MTELTPTETARTLMSDLSPAVRERMAESLADALAMWWESMTDQETYAHQWTAAAEAALNVGPSEP